MSIQEHLNKIRNAVYGREVRESIAKGIETAYDDASEKHDNANMEVKIARGTHPTLRDRLNEVDMVQKATKTEFGILMDELNTKGSALDVSKNKTDIVNTNDRIDNIITSENETINNQEIIDARAGKQTLGKHLDLIKHNSRGVNNRLNEVLHNILPTDLSNWEIGSLSGVTGDETTALTRLRSSPVPLSSKATQLIVKLDVNYGIAMHFHNQSGELLNATGYNGEIIAVPENAVSVRFLLRNNNDSSAKIFVEEVSHTSLIVVEDISMLSDDLNLLPEDDFGFTFGSPKLPRYTLATRVRTSAPIRIDPLLTYKMLVDEEYTVWFYMLDKDLEPIGDLTGATNSTNIVFPSNVQYVYAVFYYRENSKGLMDMENFLRSEKFFGISNIGSTVDLDLSRSSSISNGPTFRTIAHKGYSFEAPENTIPAYKLAKEKGFDYIETDIQWTSDGVPVLSHDETVDRCSNGSGRVDSMTLSELKQLDFGSWKDVKYEGTRIPTFEEYVLTAKILNVEAYAEFKGAVSENQVKIVLDIVSRLGMAGKFNWMSANTNNLNHVVKLDPQARIVYLATPTTTTINIAKMFKTPYNDVVFLTQHTQITPEVIDLASENGAKIEAWTVDNESDVMPLLEMGVTGIVTNKIILDDVLLDL